MNSNEWMNEAVKGQGHSLRLARGHSDFEIEPCLSQKPLIHMKSNVSVVGLV